MGEGKVIDCLSVAKAYPWVLKIGLREVEVRFDKDLEISGLVGYSKAAIMQLK